MAKLKTVDPLTVLETTDQLNKVLADAAGTMVHGFIGPRLARDLVLSQPSDYQRRLDRSTVDLYRRQMTSNPQKWRHHQFDNILAFDASGHMIEGQHRCIAAAESASIFGAFLIGNVPPGEIKYLGQNRPRSLSQTMAMYGMKDAARLATVAKMLLFWTINESPLATGRISVDEADSILAAYPEVHDWFLQAGRIKRQFALTPSQSWLTYILSQMQIADSARGPYFADALEHRENTGMPGLLLKTWSSKQRGNSLADKVWYHNTAARAWEAFKKGEELTKIVAVKGRLLDWAS